MRITCLGATRTVTGSSFLVNLNGGGQFLVDCGMFQGGSQIEMRNYSSAAYRIPDLAGIFITHAHIDHSGLVPRLVRQGYRGPVYATKATCELLRFLWPDAAHIQEMEAEWQTRKNKRRGRKKVDPLYEAVDTEEALKLLIPVELDQESEPIQGVAARFVRAGHILGAASLHLRLKDFKGQYTVGFSGDLGRPEQLIVPNPEPLPHLDTVFMETTYGSRRHKTLVDSIKELIDVINEAYHDGGKVIIPAFAVERTQEIIYTLARAYEQGEMPKDMPVYLDSPLAINATVTFRQHPEFFDETTRKLLEEGKTPINLPSLQFTPGTEDSRKINTYPGPAVIIAGSGMANAGRIKHHLKHNLWRGNCHVVIVGFQAKGTTGRKLVEGADKVKIFREDVAVRAKVHTIGGFSAHADQAELLDWLAPLVHPKLRVILIHGEESATLTFKRVAQERYPEVHFHIPKWKETIELEPVPIEEKPVRPEEVAQRIDAFRGRLARLDEMLSRAGGELDESNLSALERALEDAERFARAGGD